MGSMQSAILGYGVFQGLSAAGVISRHLSVAENVIVQTTSVATATMPLAAGLVGIIPALGLLSPEENPPTGPISFTSLQLLAWCTAMAFFGVFVAVPLRYQTIIKEKLRFPSGTATASVIQTLHGVDSSNQDLQQQPQSAQVGMQSQAVADMEMAVDSYQARIAWLQLGFHGSVGYIGQGMIMGPKTACSMMAGAVTGWAILGPLAKARGWATGPIKSIETGAAGWLMWVGLALLLGDCFSELEEDRDHSGSRDRDSWLLSSRFWIPGLLLSTLLSTSILSPLMGMPVHEPLIAVVLALLVALLAVRALGQTDLNPVSGVGKISQLVFAVVSPGAVVPNLVAGAIAEAGAQQAGDLMQDFKTAHLLGVPPSSQLVAMLLGSAASIPLSVAAFLLYTSAWEVPGPVLQAPMAQIWLDMAKLVNGGKLPDHVGPFCAAAAAIAALLPPLQHLLLHMKQQRHARHASPEVEQVDDLGPRSRLYVSPNQVYPTATGMAADCGGPAVCDGMQPTSSSSYS
eukprot:gene13158-13288_t